MIRVVVVAGKSVERVVGNLDKKEIEVDNYFEKVDELWEDILDRGSSAYADVDKIIIIANGFINESIMSHMEQIVNLQSIMSMCELRCDLYFAVKDSDLFERIKENEETTLIYRNFNMLIFRELNVKNITDVLKGLYDAKGIYHPDFLRKNEIDEMLNEAYTEADTEFEPLEKVSNREVAEDVYVDSEDMEAEIREKEKEAQRLAREQQIAAQKLAKEQEKERKRAEMMAERERLRNEKKAQDKKLKERPVQKQEDNNGFSFSRKKSKANTPPPRRGAVNFDLHGVVAFTGDRQSGISTTIANTATILAKSGLNVLIIDLDQRRRFQTQIFKNFENDVQIESRVANGLYVTLANPKNLEDVVAVVADNLSLLSLSQSVDRTIERFANRPIEQLYTASSLVTLLSFAKSVYDVVLIDFPFDELPKVGSCLSYVDRVVLCTPNTEYSLDNLFEIEIPSLLFKNDLVGHTLMSKAQILLTKYSKHSKILGKEATPQRIEKILFDIDDPIYHVEVIGAIPFTYEYENQFDTNKRIVQTDKQFAEYFIAYIENIQ